MILVPIGHLRTPYPALADCPRNGRQVQPAPDCTAVVDDAYAEGLASLDGFSHLVLLYWLGPQPADLTITPVFDRKPRGVFATRAPVRPNPIGMSVVRLVGIAGTALTVKHLDCMDGTALLDIKPYLPSTDAEPDAAMGWLAQHRTRTPA